MSETFQGTFAPEDPRKKGTEVSRPDTGLCCICGEPRLEWSRYLCVDCIDRSILAGISTEVAIHEIRARRVCVPVQEAR